MKNKNVHVIQHFKLGKYAYAEFEEAEKVVLDYGYIRTCCCREGIMYSKGEDRVLIKKLKLKGELK